MHIFFFDVFVMFGRMGTLKSQKDRRREAAEGIENTFHNVKPFISVLKDCIFLKS